MEKIKINDKIFEGSLEAKLIIKNYLDDLEFKVSKGLIDKIECNKRLKKLEEGVMDLMDSGLEISQENIEVLISNFKPDQPKQEEQKKGFFKKFFGAIIGSIKFVFKFIILMFVIMFKLIIVVTCLAFALILLGMLIGLVFIIPLSFIDINIDGLNLLSFVDDYMRVGLILLQIGIGILCIYFIFKTFKSKQLGGGIFVTGFVFLILGINGLFYSGFKIFNEHGKEFNKIETYSFPLSGDYQLVKNPFKEYMHLTGYDRLADSGVIDYNSFQNLNINNFGDVLGVNIPTSSFRIHEYTKGNMLNIEINSKIYTKSKESADIVFDNINDIDLTYLSGILVNNTSHKNLYKNDTDNYFLNRDIKIYLSE